MCIQVGVSEAARAKHLMLQSYSNVCKERKVTDDTCTICQHCFAEDDQVYVLPCQHCFHDQCVATWFKVSKVRYLLTATLLPTPRCHLLLLMLTSQILLACAGLPCV